MTSPAAYSNKKKYGESYLAANVTITENLLNELSWKNIRFIFLSSVSVYGKDGWGGPKNVSHKPRPATEYGWSKLKCEELIKQSGLPDYIILRLGPVFDEIHSEDVLKRVYLPGQKKIKMYIRPSPAYNFCHSSTLFQKFHQLIQVKEMGPKIINVVDPIPYDQNELADQFKGIGILFPRFFFLFFYYLAGFFPFKRAYNFQCNLGKLFGNNLYD